MQKPTIDAEYIQTRLQDAMATMRALPGAVGPAKLSAQSYGYVSDYEAEIAADAGSKGNDEALSGADARQAINTTFTRKSVTTKEIAEMDEAFGWLGLVENRVHRRIVALRSFVNENNGKARFSWSAIATRLGADYRAVQQWHKKALGHIANILKRQEWSV